jgi:hypothetical protein
VTARTTIEGRARRRRWAWVLAALTVVGLVIGAVVWPRSTPSPSGLAGATGSPDELAHAVCDYLYGDFAEQIRTDAPVAEDRSGLAAAREVAGRAARQDPSLFGLAGAVGALQQAIEFDDPASAEIAMAVVRAECPTNEEDS